MEALIGFINVALQLGSLVLIAVLTSMGLVTTGTLAGGVNLIGGVANGFNSLAGLRLLPLSQQALFWQAANGRY